MDDKNTNNKSKRKKKSITNLFKKLIKLTLL